MGEMIVDKDPLHTKIEPYLRGLPLSDVTGYHTIETHGFNAYLSPDGTVVNYHYQFYDENHELQYRCGFYWLDEPHIQVSPPAAAPLQ